MPSRISHEHFVSAHSSLRLGSWRRTGIINVTLASVCGLSLLICFFISISKPESSLYTSTIILESECSNTSNMIVLLHLLVNIFSTLVLASSNYFMQIVASPSRKEIDEAHKYLHSLDIGIPSVKNVQFISSFKKICWFVLALSSLPIHLFFNSVIFGTTFEGADWHLTIATEAFTHGGEFFPPGASLAPAGSPHPAYKYDGRTYFPPNSSYPYYYDFQYGGAISLEQYKNETSPIIQNITKAATKGINWSILDPDACRAEYTACKPRQQYRDVVVVVESSASNADGWSRREVYNLDADLSLTWDPYVPRNNTNSLWYSTQCTITQRADVVQSICETGDCHFIAVDYTNGTKPSDWVIDFHRSSNITNHLDQQGPFGYNEKFNNLAVKYCLAEAGSMTCKVGVSNMLLMVIAICVFTKVAQCSIILWKLPRSSLVTPGDALESFIINPDLQTTGLGTLDIFDSHQLETQPHWYWSLDGISRLDSEIKPRRWLPSTRSLFSVMPRMVWTRTYGLLLFSMAVLVFGLASSYLSNNFSLQGPFGPSGENRATGIGNSGYLGALITANTPQLLLSLCYVSYNTFFTRLQVEREWNSYGLKYQPLRVSFPAGEQTSTYRLQLPFKYSIPLLSISALCHWLLSNSLFVYISEGGYWVGDGVVGAQGYFHVSDPAFISLGYSPPAILALFIVACILIPLPFLFSLRKLRCKMVAGGSDSLVLAAACHCYASSAPSVKSPNNQPQDSGNELDDWEDRLRELSRSKLKWGAMPLSNDMAEAVDDGRGRSVMHLGFGGESTIIREPIEGEWYV
ncbi:hypothetical protein F5Y04DRAFT_270683 [Hypomontagnella monticulosa]|nr:hypothetical protein F5Y04DRAFT_270683 [Hypomontagnella monticulosa]